MSMTVRYVFRVLVLAGLAGVPVSTAAEGAVPAELKQHAAALECNLHESVVAFWLPRSIDEEHGGYRINFDIHGDPNSKTTKGLVTQARMVWFWSHMARAGAEGPKFKRSDYLAELSVTPTTI